MPSARPGRKPTLPPRRTERPADRQVAANEAVERLARDLYANECAIRKQDRPNVVMAPWEMATQRRRDHFVAFARRLIETGVVIPPPPPDTGPPPMEGQTSFQGVANL